MVSADCANSEDDGVDAEGTAGPSSEEFQRFCVDAGECESPGRNLQTRHSSLSKASYQR
jgi:hypothetical protein